MRREKYAGSWVANNGNTISGIVRYGNKRVAMRDTKKMLAGNIFDGNRGVWDVIDAATNEVVARGWISREGRNG